MSGACGRAMRSSTTRKPEIRTLSVGPVVWYYSYLLIPVRSLSRPWLLGVRYHPKLSSACWRMPLIYSSTSES